MNILEALDSVESKLVHKHQPGRHDQQKHAGDRGGARSFGDVVASNPLVKKYFSDSEDVRDTPYGERAAVFTSDLGGGIVQRLVVYESKDTGKYRAQVQVGRKGSLNTFSKSAGHDSAVAAAEAVIGDAVSTGFFTPVSEIPRRREQGRVSLPHVPYN